MSTWKMRFPQGTVLGGFKRRSVFASSVHEFDEIAKRSGNSIEPPGDDRVVCPFVVQHAEELRS